MNEVAWDLISILDKMQQQGSSVTLNWGEDTGQWECSWITAGRRFTGFGATPLKAAANVQWQVFRQPAAPSEVQ